MELLDIYDEQRRPTGRTKYRGEPAEAGEYLLAVHVWLQNSKGEYLLSKRSPEKKILPDKWECTGGMVAAGEDSLQAALREVKEELGITLNPERGYLIHSFGPEKLQTGEQVYFDVWFFRHDVNLRQIRLQPGETSTAIWAGEDDMRRMTASGELIPCAYLERMFDLMPSQLFFFDETEYFERDDADDADDAEDDDLPVLLYVVIAARYRGRWVFVRHRERDTWEMPGGHIVAGETPFEAATRELFEESGAIAFSIEPICGYGIRRKEEISHAVFFFAEIEKFDDLPDLEMAERIFSTNLPVRLTYPTIYPELWDMLRKWLRKR